MQLYFDNAATSFPKPTQVMDAMSNYQNACGASPGRGAYQSAIDATTILDECRTLLCELVNAPSPAHCIFTLNCSDSLNLAICGIAKHWLLLKKQVHVVTTAMDHNSVLRPLHAMAREGTHTIVEADPKTGLVSPKDIANAITKDTKLIAIVHGSNVTGTVQDLGAIKNLCGEIPLLVDAAQTMGHTDIDVIRDGIDLLAFPGHKGLLGPLGTGGLIIKENMEQFIEPIRFGGTGSFSEFPEQPLTLPDKYESGSHNMLGIAGLCASVTWILEQGVSTLHTREIELCEYFINECNSIEGVNIVGPQTSQHRCGVFSLQFESPCHQMALLLEQDYNIQTRAGLHCSPFAHQTMGTSESGGTVRISFGPFHTIEDIKHLAQSIRHCVQGVLI